MFTAYAHNRFRNEPRNQTRKFIEVKSLNDSDDYRIDGLLADFSDSGVAVLSYLPIPVGTPVSIKLGDAYCAKGEVVNIDPWDAYGIVRIGVHFTEKSDNWPF